MEMPPSYKRSNETWIWSGCFFLSAEEPSAYTLSACIDVVYVAPVFWLSSLWKSRQACCTAGLKGSPSKAYVMLARWWR